MRKLAVAAVVFGASSCSGPEGEEPGGSFGDGGTSQTSSGGTSSGGVSGGVSSGGGVGTGAAPTTGGAGSGGFLSGTGGDVATGGSSGGMGGEPSGGTGGASGDLVDPSPGCSLGAATLTVDNAHVGYPTGYDGSSPVPVIFAFHAAGNPSTQLEARFGNTVIGEKHLMIYLAATGSGWAMQADRGRFETAMSQVLAGACVDQNRIYALGHSSGAQFIVQLLCAGEDRFDAVIPIASSVYCSSWDPVPVLNIHGVDDQERWAYGLDDGDGRKDIVPYRTSNGCQETTAPSDLAINGCSPQITPGCVEFQGCGALTLWCNHDDPQYGTSNHGIPCFATAAIDDFLSRL